MPKGKPMQLEAEQFAILRGLLGTAQQTLAFKLDDAMKRNADERETTFYGNQMIKLEKLQRVLEEHDPRLSDTSQDVDEEEWIAGEADAN